MHPLTVALVALALCVGLGGCRGADAGLDPADPDQIEIVTWWTGGADALALEKLTVEFGRVHPGIEVFDASVAGDGGEAARSAIALRLESGTAPDVIQASAGAALSGSYGTGVLLDLTAFYDEQQLAVRFRPDVLDLLRVDGRLVAVPVDLYRANVLWIDRIQLDGAGLPTDRPDDLDDWLGDLQLVRDAGVRYPLSVGDGLSQAQLLEGVLLSRLGAGGYARLWEAPASWLERPVQDAIADYVRLLSYADPRDAARDQHETVNEVTLGDAVYVVMADRAERQFQSSGATYGVGYDAVPVPGTDGVFSVAADTFAIPAEAAHPAAARQWLSVAASATGQRVFTVAKGALPANVEVASSDYPPYQQAGIDALREDVVVPSLSQGVAVDEAWLDEIVAALEQFRAGGTEARLVDRLATAGQVHAGR